MTLNPVWMHAPDATVLDAQGTPHTLSSLWRDRAAVLYFLRHFGCPLCRQHLREVQQSLPEFARRGVEVIAIGQATGQEASHFCGKWSVEFPCLGDPRRESYDAYDVVRGSWWQVLLKSLLTHPLRSLRLLADADLEGLRLASTDIMQLPGVAIVEAGGVLRARHIADTAEDMPSPERVLALVDDMGLDLGAGRTRRERIAVGAPDAFGQLPKSVA